MRVHALSNPSAGFEQPVLQDVIVVGSATLGSPLSLAASVMRQDEKPASFDRWQACEVTVTAELHVG